MIERILSSPARDAKRKRSLPCATRMSENEAVEGQMIEGCKKNAKYSQATSLVRFFQIEFNSLIVYPSGRPAKNSRLDESKSEDY